MRDGVPLPGRSPTEVLSQLAHRVFGPLHPAPVRVVLDYHGLAGSPAGRLAEVAARHQVTSRTVSNHVAAVRAAGARLPLAVDLIAEATRISTQGDDHRARVRTARTLGLPAPAAPQLQGRGRSALSVSPAHVTAARAAARVLAVVGPLPLDALLAAVNRSRRFRGRTPLQAAELGAALAAVGATAGPDGSWHASPGSAVPDRYRAIVDAAGGSDRARQQMIEVLIDRRRVQPPLRRRADELLASAVRAHRPRPVPAHRPPQPGHRTGDARP